MARAANVGRENIKEGTNNRMTLVILGRAGFGMAAR